MGSITRQLFLKEPARRSNIYALSDSDWRKMSQAEGKPLAKQVGRNQSFTSKIIHCIAGFALEIRFTY